MDCLILEGVVRVLGRALSGCSLLRWDRLAEAEYLLRFATAAGDNLKISLRPPHPALYRLPHAETPPPIPPDPFSGRASRELEGATLVEISRRGCDRVVEMEWESASGARRHLVAELIGKSANLLLLDEDARILAYSREMASAFRAPVVGERYQPPVPRPGLEGANLAPESVEAMLERFDPSVTPGEAAVGVLKALSPPLASDFSHREGALLDPVKELQRILGASWEDRLKPILYTALPPEELLRRPEAAAEVPVLSPLPLTRAPAPIQTRFADCEEAVRVAMGLLEARHRTRELRGRLAGTLRREESRLERLISKLEGELEESGRAETHQRFGDLILACPTAKVEGSWIVVPDLYDPHGKEVRIPSDPALGPRENAQRHYEKARKLRRGAEKVRERLQGISAEGGAVAGLRRRLEQAETREGLLEIEVDLIHRRILRPVKEPGGRGREIASENDPGIRKFRTEDGFVILVGKTSRDNDRLTFQVASPHDFWFHAADRSGAHVVVRNPSRLSELPKPVALAAARVAAHFSRARGKGKVEVHYTLRKHVRKGKRYAPGLVSLRNHRTLEVEPGIPGSESEERS